ncbi:hypothetical protein BpHYR1_017931 [Brachionus plicatilis]|uniref:Uncharacterized protein n=1 Tax=Brachionus plicatilis TaxID=10195 RepID=A0A3M7SX74_BRAPC|nr:hypothetical protein BpHYR1_017931 [Brachionus plicatilis]
MSHEIKILTSDFIDPVLFMLQHCSCACYIILEMSVYEIKTWSQLSYRFKIERKLQNLRIDSFSKSNCKS